MVCNCGSEAAGRDGPVDFQYAVKIVCGLLAESKDNSLPAGQYFTKTNVHNFSRCDAVTFRWKVAVGLPHLQVGPISDFADATLGPDEALEIDCADALKLLGRGAKADHFEGWLVIEGPSELDVVAVYGSTQSPGGQIATFATERVQPRCLPSCGNFDLDISTGVSAWEFKGPGANDFSPATLSQPVGSWAVPPAGSLWIVPGSLQAEGDYTYRLRFKLCSGFKAPKLDLMLLADYFANVFLNGHQMQPHGSASSPMFGAPTNFAAATHFKAGLNELTIVVTNTEKASPVGLAVHGSIEVANGLCKGEPMPLLPCPGVCYRLYTREFWRNEFLQIYVDILARAEEFSCNGAENGITNGRRRAEQLEVLLSGSISPGTSIEYRVFTRNLVTSLIGWSNWTTGGFCGVTGANHPITAIEMRLINAPVNCHIRYRVCTRPRLLAGDPNTTWSQDYYDGATAGTTAAVGYLKRFPPIVALIAEIV